MLPELTGHKDGAQVSADGRRLAPMIHDVRVREQPNVPTRNGVTAEAWRSDWGLGGALQQILVVHLRPAAISAWHRHARQTDHIYCIQGALRLVMYDARPDSPSHGVVDVRLLHPARPQLIVVPRACGTACRIWIRPATPASSTASTAPTSTTTRTNSGSRPIPTKFPTASEGTSGAVTMPPVRDGARGRPDRRSVPGHRGCAGNPSGRGRE